MDLQDLRIRERLEDLDLRTWLNDNTAVTTIAAVVLLMIALGIMLMTVTGGGGVEFKAPTQKYFYDLNAGELFVVPIDELPPVERGAPYALSGGVTIPAGVEAVVFGPEGASPDQYIVGWVETLRPEKRDEILAAIRVAESSGDAQAMGEYEMLRESEYSERLVMDPNAADPRFFPRFSKQGQEIINRRFRDDAGEPLRPVFPD
ncbi:MAG: hypothetical protein AAF328_09510 [Planctomycetota bacterium]